MTKKNRIPLFLLSFLLISGCISVSDLIGGSDYPSEPPVDEVGQLLSDIQSETDNETFDTKEETLSREKLENAEEKLDPVPTQEYDSALIEEKEELIEETEKVQEIVLENQVDEESSQIKAIEATISKLNIEDKIQYRVATINFYTGSSQVDNIGLKKIKKIAKIAKDRNAKIKIVGHASKRTRDMPLAKHKLVNFNISDKRAQSVANIFLNKHNFPSVNLIAEAVSDTKPLFKENMPAGTKANQRTEIFLIY